MTAILRALTPEPGWPVAYVVSESTAYGFMIIGAFEDRDDAGRVAAQRDACVFPVLLAAPGANVEVTL